PRPALPRRELAFPPAPARPPHGGKHRPWREKPALRAVPKSSSRTPVRAHLTRFSGQNRPRAFRLEKSKARLNLPPPDATFSGQGGRAIDYCQLAGTPVRL